MATKVSVTLVGVAELKRTFSSMPSKTRDKMARIIQDSALNIQMQAKARCPVNKKIGLGGRLRGSVRIQFYNNGLTGDIGTDVKYGPYVEFGTGQRGKSSNHPELPAGYVHGLKAGMPAQPFLTPAFEQERPQFLSRIAKEITE